MTQSQSNVATGFLKRTRARLLSGLLVLVPFAITILILRIIVAALTGFVRPFLAPWTDDLPEHVLTLIAAVVTLLVIYLVGVITAHLVGRRLIRFGESILLRLPIVKSVYAAAKQVVETFSESTQAAFKAVVLVEFPRAGSLAVGFVTGTILDSADRKLYRVFVPTTPNPTSGFLVILPTEEVRFTDISIEDGIRMIVSGGVLAPRRYGEVKRQRNAAAPRTIDTSFSDANVAGHDVSVNDQERGSNKSGDHYGSRSPF